MLQLPWISQRRGILLAEAYLQGQSLPVVQELCEQEAFALPKALMRCSLLANASIAQLKDAAQRFQLAKHLAQDRRASNGSASHGDDLSAALQLYAQDSYILLPFSPDVEVQQGIVGSVSALLDFKPRFVLALRQCASARDKLQALLQAAAHQRHLQQPQQGSNSTLRQGPEAVDAAALLAAHQFARDNVAEFEKALQSKGWRVDDVIAWSGQNNVLQN